MSEHIVKACDVLSGSVSLGSDCLSFAPSPCVYFLISCSEIVYVGLTKNLKARLSGHKLKSFDSVSWVGCEEELLELVEAVNIHHHSPPLNILMPNIDAIISSHQASKMNKQQINTMATRLNLKPLTAEACALVLIDGMTAYAAEKQVYGKRMGTIGKACARLRSELEYCQQVAIEVAK